MGDRDSAKAGCSDEGESNAGAVESPESSAGVSPYATGGGGVTFERKVAVQYLAHLLVGDRAVEFGEGRRAMSVAFQQAPDQLVDDLVVRTALVEELEPSGEIAIEVRGTPNLVSSDERTQGLVRKFVRALMDEPTDDIDRRWGLVVSGPQPHAEQLAKLASLAGAQMDSPGFFDLVRTPSKFNAATRNRLCHLERLVEDALKSLGVAKPDTELVRERTWRLLSKLIVLMPRLESPDETDWAAVENRLIAVSRTADLTGASRLRDRLAVLASEYSPTSARVDLTLLRRHAHEALNSDVRHHQKGWGVLNDLHDKALGSVRGEIVADDGANRMALDRSDAAKELIEAVGESEAVLVGGDSGVGKSALTLRTLAAACEVDPEGTQVLCINLRHIPQLTLDFNDTLGSPLSTLLSELSAPQRVFVVDGADAVTEGMVDAFTYLVDAALENQVRVVVVASTDSMQVVRNVLTDRFGAGVAECAVKPLTDTELNDIARTFPELGSLNDNPRSRELLRRLVVVDLLVRGHPSGVPLSDADAMDQVWSGLVRRHEKSDKGYPDARETVLLRLAALSLGGNESDERLDVISRLDAAAISGLRHDGLLQPSLEKPFMFGPDFSHDEVRRYAVARLLLAEGDPTSRILSAGAPRWALGAARLACQAMLALPDMPASPLQGRFAKLQASFDEVVTEGHGTRWGDVPSEALVTLPDPGKVLRDSWPRLRADDDTGLRRLVRLVDQRLRRDNGIVDYVAIEPIVKLLLEDEAPWQSGKYASDLLREWLRAHAFVGTPEGCGLRIRLREQLIEASVAADVRLAEKREAEAAARAARTPEEVERDRQFAKSNPAFLPESRSRNRPRLRSPKIPLELRDQVFLELLALVGPDLGGDGEAILRRIARDAPSWLAPAVEEPFTDFALAHYGRGLLAHLTQAYYLDENGIGSMDYGIRSHSARRGGLLSPLASWHLGPFMTLFRTDFLGGVATLNRLLNHAAVARARTLADLDSMFTRPADMDASPYRTDLEVTGTSRVYVGDEHVWMWYRGTGVGPYPCMSALQALELTCDQLIKAGIPIKDLVPLLLDGCENLAMVGLVVGILVRHLEAADDLLDPYFTEPLIWNYEFTRLSNEHSGLAADSGGIEAAERRKWSLRDAAITMALRVDDDRAAALRALGEKLIERAHSLVSQEHNDSAAKERPSGVQEVEVTLARVKAWANNLDRSSFEFHGASDGLYIQVKPSQEVAEALQPMDEYLGRTEEELRLLNRYFFKRNQVDSEPIEPDELSADVASARKLLESPTSLTVYPWDVPALVAATALEAYLLGSVDVPNDALCFAAETVLWVSEDEGSQGSYEFEGTHFELGAQRSAARVLPLLLLPAAAHIRAMMDGADGSVAMERVSVAGLSIARAVAREVRLHLARGLDHLWATPCVQEEPCHHKAGWQIAAETMRDCVIGDWDPEIGMRSVAVLDQPLDESISNTKDGFIMPSRLDPSIRALAPAATANICVSTDACELLTAVLAAQRRSLLYSENSDMDQQGTHSLVSARALLTLALQGNDGPLYEHINAYANHPALLGNLLGGLSAAAEETPGRAALAKRIWPDIVRHVLDMHSRGQVDFQETFHGEMALAALIPNAAYEAISLNREVHEEPIEWWEPLELRPEVESWLTAAAGSARCVDQIIGFLRVLAPEDQARVGLPWIAKLVLASPSNVATDSYLAATWLIEARSAATSASVLATWQQIVDALVVEGVVRLAPYSE